MVQILENPEIRVKYFFNALSLQKKLQVSTLTHSKVITIFKKNSFQVPIRPLVQILESPETRIKYFLMLYLLKQIWVSRFIHSKVIIMFKKNSFQSPIWPLVHISRNPALVRTSILGENFRALALTVWAVRV